MKIVSNSRLQQLTMSTRQPTPNSQEATITPDTDTRHLMTSNKQPPTATADNQNQMPDYRQPTPDNY